jgi:DNA mismatch endonuclease (patch repair protein)
MTDVLTPEQRQRNMSRIRGRDTKPEMFVRRGLHACGFRYRLQDRQLPGRPDLVFPRYHAVIFVHGCFWHGHDCPMFNFPTTRREFWEAKIVSNRARDEQTTTALLESGWRVANVWECSVKGPARLPEDEVIRQCRAFLLLQEAKLVNIRGDARTHEE